MMHRLAPVRAVPTSPTSPWRTVRGKAGTCGAPLPPLDNALDETSA